MYKESEYNIEHEINGEKYIYNSISKSFAKNISNKTVQNMLENKELSEKEICELLTNGLLVERARNEIKEFEYLCKKHFFNSSELNIILVPTMNCNFDCSYCFEASHKNIKTKDNYFEILKKYSQKYFKFYRHIEISLFGGEPLLVKRELMDYLSYVRKLSEEYSFTYSSSITTNGSLLDVEVLEDLVYHNCKSLQITIDGGKNSHDKTRSFKNGKPSFDLLINKINMILAPYIRENRFSFNLRINLNNNKEKEVYDTLKLINSDLRSNITVIFRPIFNTEVYKEKNDNTLFSLNKFYEMGKKLGYKISKSNYFYRSCESCGDENFFYLLPNLTIWKCINKLSSSEAKIGEISESGDFMLNAKNMIEWYNATNCFDDQKCKKCKLLPDCLGGCILKKVLSGNRQCSPFELVSLPYFY